MVVHMMNVKMLITFAVLLLPCLDVVAQAPAKHLKNLMAEDFETRQHACDELGLWAERNKESAPKVFHSLWKKQDDPEAKARCYGLMKNAFFALPKQGRPGFIGVGIGDTILPGVNGEEPRRAVLINSVSVGKAGDKAGLKAGDAVVELDALDFQNLPENQVLPFNNGNATRHFIDYIKSKKEGDVVTLLILRGDKELKKKVTLIAWPVELDHGADTAQKLREQAFKKWLEGMNK